MELHVEGALVALLAMCVNLLYARSGAKDVPEPDRAVVTAADQRKSGRIDGQRSDGVKMG